MKDSTETLVQVTARHYCAGLVVRDGHVVRAAPILWWAVGRTEAEARARVERSGGDWRVIGR